MSERMRPNNDAGSKNAPEPIDQEMRLSEILKEELKKFAGQMGLDENASLSDVSRAQIERAREQFVLDFPGMEPTPVAIQYYILRDEARRASEECERRGTGEARLYSRIARALCEEARKEFEKKMGLSGDAS
jgi:hypothetical protein